MEQAIGYLPQLLHDRPEANALELVASDLLEGLQGRALWLRWPHSESPTLEIALGDDSSPPQFPSPNVANWGNRHVCSQSQGTQVFVPLPVVGRDAGILGVQLPATVSWDSRDFAIFETVAKLLGASPILGRRLGGVIDQSRLLQRLNDAAVICGRMAHDFDNILTGILGFTDLTMPMIPPGSQIAHFLTEVSKAGQRGIVFTQQLHQLSRAGNLKPQPGNLGVILTREEARLRPILKADQRLEYRLPSDLPNVALEATPLQSVIGHLLDNAIEAVPWSGTLTVSARSVELDARAAESYLGRVQAGPMVEVTIQDCGPGIKPEHRSRLFAEPFFTTKVRHRGLGLAIVYRILYGHFGGIRLEPRPDRGTVARVVLPLTTQRLSNSGAVPQVLLGTPSGVVS